MKLTGLTNHSSIAKDNSGCEFQYTCYTHKYWMGGEQRVERHYIAYDGKGTGLQNQIAEGDTLKELKRKMSQL